MKKFCMILIALLLCGANAWAQAPNLMMPLPINDTWILTRAYNAPPTHLGSDQYALDFTKPGCEAWNVPIYAAAPGIVEILPENDYGRNLFINHGNGYKTHYAHLQIISVSGGQSVDYGTPIGTCGNSGNTVGTACSEHPGTHLHFKMLHDGNPAMPEPLSGYINFPNGEPGSNYFVPPIGYFSDGWHSDGISQAFLEKYDQLSIESHYLGNPWDNGPGDEWVHEQNGMYIQDFRGLSNGFWHPYTALIRKAGAGETVRLLKEGFWDYWMNNCGWVSFGPPITDDDEGTPPRQQFSLNGMVAVFAWENGAVDIENLAGESIEMNDVTFVCSSPSREVDGVYHSGLSVTQFNAPVDLVHGSTYAGFYALVNLDCTPFFRHGIQLA